MRWSFGDGQESSNDKPVYKYDKGGNYTIQLISTSKENCRDTTRAVQIVSEPVVVAFEQDRKEGCSPMILNLSNKNIVPSAQYIWTFGNGKTSTQAQPDPTEFLNNSFGDTTYRIKLEAVTPGCAQSVAESAVTVYVGVKARFEPDLKVGCAPHKVTFSNVSIGAPRTYEWDFGNGKQSSEEFPTAQTYTIDSTAKTYRIRLIASNFCGSDTTYREVIATPANVKAFFGIDRIEGCAPLSINVASAATNGSQITYSLGDGNTVTTPNFAYTYPKAGTYEIMQKASGSCGTDQTKRIVTVWETPLSRFFIRTI
ncbi:MAG: hypothetical protein HC782_04705 [Gammaproteobacteria bacterium]|nr:hypothetical protein [Gammaproteobacteria bacterium]